MPFKLYCLLPFIVFLVEAPHLDLRSNQAFLCSMAKHPSNWSKNGDVGHAWILLQGCKDGKRIGLEGGHSGELGEQEPTYFDGVMQYACEGEPNPVKYLGSPLHDGFFQQGSGGHCPTYAVAINLSQDQFEEVLKLISTYDFRTYSLTDHQCCTFVAEIAAKIGVELDCKVSLTIEPVLKLRRQTISLWEDPKYRVLHFESPDVLEKQLRTLVQEGQAVDALKWYRKNYPIASKRKGLIERLRGYFRWSAFLD